MPASVHDISSQLAVQPSLFASNAKDLASNFSHQKLIHVGNLPSKINYALDTYYKIPLPTPGEITAQNLDGFTVRWNDLSFSQQHEIIMHHHKGGCTSLCLPYEGPLYCEETIPRWTHGLMHATRAALLVRMVANMYNEFHPTIKVSEGEIILAQFLAAYHDSARQAEGLDIWDNESAANIYAQMNELRFSEPEIFECMDYLARKDSTREGKHIISKLIQCADCLDIMRIYGPSEFNNAFLDIFHDLGQSKSFITELELFKKEFYSFICKTDAPLLRLHLETQSENYFSDTQALMLMREGGAHKYPLLAKWTAQSAKEPSRALKLVFEAKTDKRLGDFFIIEEILNGTHKAYILEDKAGALFFFKNLEKTSSSHIESISSKIAKKLTSGLVPNAEVVKIGSKF